MVEAGYQPINGKKLKLYRSIPEVELRIIGFPADLSYERRIKKMVLNGNILQNVKLLGAISKKDLLREYAECSVLVLPSYEESAGVVIAEAMAAGKPVIATNRGGMPDLVENGYTGILVEYGDVEALAAAIVRLLRDPVLSERLGRCAREKSRARFSIKNVAEKTYQVYKAILERTG